MSAFHRVRNRLCNRQQNENAFLHELCRHSPTGEMRQEAVLQECHIALGSTGVIRPCTTGNSRVCTSADSFQEGTGEQASPEILSS